MHPVNGLEEENAWAAMESQRAVEIYPLRALLAEPFARPSHGPGSGRIGRENACGGATVRRFDGNKTGTGVVEHGHGMSRVAIPVRVQFALQPLGVRLQFILVAGVHRGLPDLAVVQGKADMHEIVHQCAVGFIETERVGNAAVQFLDHRVLAVIRRRFIEFSIGLLRAGQKARFRACEPVMQRFPLFQFTRSELQQRDGNLTQRREGCSIALHAEFSRR